MSLVDLEAARRAAAGFDVSNAERKEEEKEERKKEKVQNRMEASQTSMALRDWMFNTAPSVADARAIIEPEVQGLREVISALEEAAAVLDDKSWRRLTEIPFTRIHQQDQDVHTTVFTKAEPSWKNTMTMPKSGKTCIILFIGTEPPSETVCKLFSRLGWFGVNIGPKMTPGFEDCITPIELDPGSHKDEEEFFQLLQKRGGQVPKPVTFPLVYANLMFDLNVVEEDSEEEEELPDQVQDRWAEFAAQMPPDVGKDGEPDLYQDMRKGSQLPCPLGVTRTTHVRRRLRAIRNSLVVALHRLADKGTLVICWPGLPWHPVLMYVVASLRGLFQRTHLLIQESTALTFEMYILCANFNREASESGSLGGDGSLFKSFMDSSYRRNGVDDVLLWTLTDKALWTEARVGAGGKATQKSWDDIWTAWARKLKTLVNELDEEGQNLADTKKKAAPKAKAESKKKDEEEEDPAKAKADKAKAKADKAAAKADKAAAKADKEGDAPKEKKKTLREKKEEAAAEKKAKAKLDKAADKKEDEGEAGEGKKDDKGEAGEGTKGGTQSAQAAAPPVAPAPDAEEEEVTAQKKKTARLQSKPSQMLPPVADAEEAEAAGASPTEEKADELTKPGTAESGSVRKPGTADSASGKLMRQRRRLHLSRSLPTLAGSLGSCPGAEMSKGADVRNLATKWPIIKFGYRSAEMAALFG